MGGGSGWRRLPPPLWVQSQRFSKTGRGSSSCWESRSGSPSPTCLGPSDPSQDLGEVEPSGRGREGQIHAGCGPRTQGPLMAQLGHRRGRQTDKGSPVGWCCHPSPLLFPFCSPISGTTGRTVIRNGAQNMYTRQAVYLELGVMSNPPSSLVPSQTTGGLSLSPSGWEKGLETGERRPLGCWRGPGPGPRGMMENFPVNHWVERSKARGWGGGDGQALGDCSPGVTGHPQRHSGESSPRPEGFMKSRIKEIFPEMLLCFA